MRDRDWKVLIFSFPCLLHPMFAASEMEHSRQVVEILHSRCSSISHVPSLLLYSHKNGEQSHLRLLSNQFHYLILEVL